MLEKFTGELRISSKDFFIVFVLLVNAFAWFYLSPIMIDRIVEGINTTSMQENIIQSAYYGGIVISSIVGSILSKKINRLKLIYAWIVIGIITSMAPLLFSSFTWIDCLTISILLGTSFGLGIPSCLSYFADITKVENRGRISGIVLLTANIAAPILYDTLVGFDLTTYSIIFAGWRSLGLIVFFLHPNKKNSDPKIKLSDSFRGIIKDKTFSFYLLAWIMFCLVDRIVGPIVIASFGDFSDTIMRISPIAASITMLIAGTMADWIGRKRIVLYGFISLGIAYAIIGIMQKELLVNYFFAIVNGITGGLLFVSFILILWGDIAQSGSKEIYYTMGVIPLFLTRIIGLPLNGYIKIQEASSFSLAAFFLFLAVLPLLYAPETLPEKKMELRRLREFAEDAKKAKEKYERKMKV
jgi:MFS family permease